MSFFKKYQGFIANCFALACMLGACFGAVIYIQEAPNKAIAALATATAEADLGLEKKIVQEATALRTERNLLKEARDKEIFGLQGEMRTEFRNIKNTLERIEQRQYDQRKRADLEELQKIRPAGG